MGIPVVPVNGNVGHHATGDKLLLDIETDQLSLLVLVQLHGERYHDLAAT